MHRLLRSTLVIASAVAVATCADAPTGLRNGPPGLRARLAVAPRFTELASRAAGRLTDFGIEIDNVRITLTRLTGQVVLDTVITVSPGDTLAAQLPVTISGTEEQLVARIELRQDTTVIFSGQQTVLATATGSSTPSTPATIEVEYTGPGATVARIRIAPRDSVLLTTARPLFAVVGTDAAGTVLPVVPISWSSTDAAVATVDALTGALTPLRRGSFTLAATTLTGIADSLHIRLHAPAASIAVASGDGQTGIAGRTVDAPLVVQVLAADGLPAAGELVRFATTGSGTVSAAEVRTDTGGRAATTITLGRTLGTQDFTATVEGLPPATVTLQAVAGAAATLTPGTPGPLPGTVAQPLAAPLSVLVQDDLGLPVANATVAWTAPAGAGTLAASTSTSGADGIARVQYTHGTRAGSLAIGAAVGSVQASIAVTAVADVPATLVVVSGSPQQAGTAAALTPFVVRLSDRFDNPVAGAAVNWTRTVGSGTVTAATSITDSTGQASSGYTTGTVAGVDEVAASAGALVARFTVTTAAGPASRITRVAGDSQTVVAGTAIPVPLEARVTDANGNGTTGAVDLTVSGPGLSAPVQSVLATDAQGLVTVTSASLQRPRLAGTYTATLAVSGQPSSAVSFTVVVVPAPPARLALIAAPSTGTSGDPLQPQPAIQVLDSIGNVVNTPGIAVTVAVAGSYSLGGTATALTTAGGAAFAGLSISGPAGTATLTFGAPGLAPVATTVVIGAGSAAAATSTLAVDSTSLVVGGTSLLTLTIRDASGNLVPGVAAGDVTFTATAGTTGTVSCTGSTCTAAYTAPATVATVTLGATIAGSAVTGTATLTVRAGAAAAATSTLAVASASLAAGDSTAITVTVRDAAGNLVTSAGPGDLAIAASAGTLRLPACANGVCSATFVAPAGGATVAVTATIAGANVQGSPATIAVGAGAPSAATSTVTMGATSLTAGATTSVTIQVKDAAGAAVTSAVPADVAVVVTAGTLGTPTCTGGTCTAVYTAATTAGTATLTATIGGTDVQGSPVTITTVTSGTTVAGVAVTPAADTLHSLGDDLQLTATALDSTGAPTPGAFTWTSRNPSAVVVDTLGRVTAVGNGAAYVIAAERGGAADSAHVVVQQRVATVMVTPGAQAVYVGASQQFTAAAVDGRGNAVGAPAFTWTSTAPGVATVDSTGRIVGLAIGSTQVRATTDGVTGVASLAVRTPITRIAVGVDSASVPVADPSAMVSLDALRRLIAVAYDTLGAPMTGVAFTWRSTNGSVAQLDSIAATSAYARSAANGTTSVTASAQGVTGSTAVRVQQVLAAIELTPASATVAPTGAVAVVARGRDANGFFIPGGSFAYASSATGVATVNASSGVVTGVSTGRATITASAGGVTSNGAVITVSNQVPPVLSFGRDTLSVGRGATTSVPVYVSVPSPNGVTVSLAVADTFAYFSTATITIPANQSSANATLVGRSAGVTRVVALDASQSGYAGDTAALAVQATLRLASPSYNMNATDSRETQVLLSDPSPPGGTYVTLTFANDSIASASPNPAFIPAGQLAADVIITGASTTSSTRSTTVTPSAIGVNGTASSVTVSPSNLLLSRTSLRIGAGQYRDDLYVYTNNANTSPIAVTLTSSDSTVASVTRNVTIPAGSSYAYFTASARMPGSATIGVSAPGWTTQSLAVVVTTPGVEICCGGSLTTTAPQQAVQLYATDSLASAHWRTSSLVTLLASSDPGVIRVVDSIVTIDAGQYASSAGRIIPGGTPGTAWVRVSAGGHRPDSVQYTVTGPKLQFSTTLRRLGAGQASATDVYVYTPHTLTSPLSLTLVPSDSGIVATPQTLTIPAGTNYVYVPARAGTAGSMTLVATAPGYEPDTMTYVATTPRLLLSGGGAVSNFAPPRIVSVYTADSLGATHNRSDSLRVSLRSTDTSVIAVDSVAIVAPNTYYTQTAKATIVGVGSASVIVTAPGHVPDTLAYTVTPPPLVLNRSSYTIGAGQQQTTAIYVQVPNTRTSSLTVTLAQANPAVVGVDTALTIASGQSYQYVAIRGRTTGVDTIVTSAPGYLPDTVVVRVSTPALKASTLPSGRTTTSPPFATTLYAADSLGTVHYVTDTVVVHVTSSDSNVIRPAASPVRILPGSYYVQPTINIVGPGTATLTFTDSSSAYRPFTTAAMTVTGPALSMSHSGGGLTLGMGQTTGSSGAYVQVPNAVTQPLVVRLLSSSTRVVTVPDSVTIPTGSSYAYFTVDAQDTVGTIQVQATATGYGPSSMNVKVTVPKLLISTSTSVHTTTSPLGLTVYAADANGTTHYMRAPLTVTLASSMPGVATIDSTTVTIQAGEYYNSNARWMPGTAGTSQLTASDARTSFSRFTSATTTVTVNTPKVSIGGIPSSLGIGQYVDNTHVYTPDYAASPITVTLRHAGTPRTSTPSTVVIPAGNYYQYFRMSGLVAGTDTLVSSASSPAHVPDTAYTRIAPGRIDPIGGWPAALRVGDSVQVTLYARDPDQNVRKVAAATTWSLAPSAGIEFRSGGAATTSVVITSVTIPADADRITFYVKALAAGAATATIASSDYTTYTNSLTVNP